MIHHSKEYLVKSAIITLILGELLYLIISGQYLYYVHPRILIFLKICVILFALLLFVNIRMLREIRHVYNYKYCKIVVLPFLIMAGMSMFSQTSFTSQKKEKQKEEKESGISAPLKERIHNSHFELLDSEIYQFNRLLYDQRDVLNGKIVTYNAYVHFTKDTGKNQFMAARMTMFCCAADMIPDGLIVHMDKAPTWSEGTWIHLTGKIQYEYKKNDPIPFAYIQFISAQPTQKPISDIVYPEF